MIGLEVALFLKKITLHNVCLRDIGKISARSIFRCQAVQEGLTPRAIEVNFQKGIFFFERINDLSSVG
jgi:hypothetical protein